MSDLTAKMTINASGKYTKALDLTTVKDTLSKTYTHSLADGTSSSQADQQWHDMRNLAASGTDSLDLTALSDAFGATLTFAKVRGLIIHNLSGVQTLTVGNASSSAWVGPFGAAAHTISVKPGATQVLVMDGAGYSVTASSASTLLITNAASSACSYDIIIWGTSA